MENNIEIFNHEFFGNARFIVEGDSFVVVAKDVVEGVGNVWKNQDSIKHIPQQWRGTKQIGTPRGIQEMTVLSEQGLYFYLGRCDKPAALQYQMWIAGEVVPNIRKHGGHLTHAKQEEVRDNPDAIYELAARLLKDREQRELAEEKLHYLKPKVPFGTPSRFNGKPRISLIGPYWKTKTTTVTTETIEYQRRLFDFE